MRANSFGLDISDESLRFAELIRAKNGITLGQYGEYPIPFGVLQDGKILDPEKIEEILRTLKKETRMKSVHLSLPGEHKENLNDYFSALHNADIHLGSFVPQTEAVLRSIIKRGDTGTSMVLHFDTRHSAIFVVSNGAIVFDTPLYLNGEMLTTLLQTEFYFSAEEAEAVKMYHGLSRKAEHKEIFKIISKYVSLLCEEIQRHFVRWHIADEKHTSSITKIFICGTESQMPGLSEYISVSMRHPVHVANVWTNILDTDTRIPELKSEHAPAFTAALGLALSDFIN